MLDGAGEPAGQIVPDGIGGSDPVAEADGRRSSQGAKKLLADAGFPQGFGMTIHTSNDRFAGRRRDPPRRSARCSRRGGIKVNGVVAQPYNVYATAAGKQTFSAFIFSLGNTTPTSATGSAQPADDARQGCGDGLVQPDAILQPGSSTRR